MRTRATLSLALGLLAALPALATASPDPGSVVTVEADVHGAEHQCPPAGLSASCPAGWDTNGTVSPGDDDISAVVFVDEARVTVRPPTGNAPPQRIAVDPSRLVIRHPVNQDLNRTWLRVNDSRPDAIRPYVAFESRQWKACWQGEWTYGDWGIFLTFYPPPAGGTKCDSPDHPWSLVEYCWDYCFIDGEPAMQQSEDEIHPFPGGVSPRNDSKDSQTDDDVDEEIRAAETCSATDCGTLTKPILDPLDEHYHDLTPNAHTGFRFNRTSVVVNPEKLPRDSALSADVNTTMLESSSPGQTVILDAGAPSEKVESSPPLHEKLRSSIARPDAPPSRPPPEIPIEPPNSPQPHDPTAALLAAAGALAALGLAFAWGLYMRIGRREVLDQDTRRRVLEEITAVPGQRTTDLARRVGVGRKTIRHHLQKLRDSSLVSVRAETGHQPRYFPIGQSEMDARKAAALAHPTLRSIYNAVEQREADHVTLASLANVSRSHVSREIAKLEALGLVTQARIGKRFIVRIVGNPVSAASGAFGVA